MKSIALLLIAIMIIPLAFFGCETTESKSNNESSQTENAESQEKEQSEELEMEQTGGVGDTLSTGMLNIELQSVNVYEKMEGDTYTDTPDEGKVYFVAKFEIKNIGDEDKYFSSGDFDCYVDGYTVSTKIIMNDPPEGATMNIGNVAPGKKMAGTLIYMINEDWEEIEIVYDDNIISQTRPRLTFELSNE